MFSDATVAIPNIQSGRVVALGTSSAKPTTLIAGGVPAILATLGAELRRIQSTPEFRALLVKFGMDPSPPNTPEQFAAIVKGDVARWAKAVADSGAAID